MTSATAPRGPLTLRRTSRRALAIGVAAITAFATPTAVSLAEGGGAGDAVVQNVIADNSQGGTVLARSGMVAARAGRASDNTSPSNLAQANAHDCAAPCQALAAAFQIVLVPAGTTTQAPQNVALATNVSCTGCGAFAYAYQYVVNVAREVTISGHAQHQIAALRREADQDVRAGLDYPTLDARLHDLASRFRGVVDADLAQQQVGENGKHSFQAVKQRPAA